MPPLFSAPAALGLATVGYGASLIARPGSLASQLGIADQAKQPSVRVLSTVFAVREIASGLACALAPKASQRRLALLLRAAFDAGDTVACVAFLPATPASRRAAIFAGVWSVLALAAAATTRDR